MGLTGKGKNTEAAKELGARSAKALAGRKFKSVVFDRGSNKYHGVVKAFADALREGGIKV